MAKTITKNRRNFIVTFECRTTGCSGYGDLNDAKSLKDVPDCIYCEKPMALERVTILGKFDRNFIRVLKTLGA
jgi:hypothetical protein